MNNRALADFMLGGLCAFVVISFFQSCVVRAEEVIAYTDKDGTIAFTDDMENVPEAYKSATTIVDTDKLEPKLTISETPKPQTIWNDYKPEIKESASYLDHWEIRQERRQQGNHHNSVMVIYLNGEEFAVIDN